MTQTNTAEKIETPVEKLARLEAENKELQKQASRQSAPGKTPGSVKIDIDGMGFTATHRMFSSGSSGFHANGKTTLADGKRYTINVLLVEIGSKPVRN